MSEPSTNGPTGDESRSEHIPQPARDAEQVAEEWAGRIGHWILSGLARAKEEAEDIWSDAQALRREL